MIQPGEFGRLGIDPARAVVLGQRSNLDDLIHGPIRKPVIYVPPGWVPNGNRMPILATFTDGREPLRFRGGPEAASGLGVHLNTVRNAVRRGYAINAWVDGEAVEAHLEDMSIAPELRPAKRSRRTITVAVWWDGTRFPTGKAFIEHLNKRFGLSMCLKNVAPVVNRGEFAGMPIRVESEDGEQQQQRRRRVGSRNAA